ncbi:MAG: SIMPL domain-containing protein [Rhizobiales bacterium]|nr:SIMPL domain-containing protein [Hyphomicrobiales bacterium]
MLRSSLAALAITALAVMPAISHASAQEQTSKTRTITIIGHGEARISPDLAVITLGVMNSAATAREALDANNAAMDSVMTALKSAGIAPNDMQTSNFTISPRYDFGQDNRQPPRVVAYDVSNTVTITVRKLETLGKVLDQVVSQGSNQINGIMFSVSNPSPTQDEARKAAVADAQRKAKLFADTAGVKLGDLVSISEVTTNPQPVPTYRKTMQAEAASSVPIAEGEQTIAVDVNIVWEID